MNLDGAQLASAMLSVSQKVQVMPASTARRSTRASISRAPPVMRVASSG